MIINILVWDCWRFVVVVFFHYRVQRTQQMSQKTITCMNPFKQK